MEWHLLQASRQAGVNLAMALCGGQCFRWYATPRATYVGVVQDRVYELRETACAAAATTDMPGRHCVEYRRLYPPDLPSSGSAASMTGAAVRRRAVQAGHCVCEARRDERFLTHYLALDVDVKALWHEWTVGNAMRDHPLVRHLAGLHDTTRDESEDGVRAARAAAKVSDGKTSVATASQCPCNPVRHLRQDLHETLLSFVCSQNNHVRRITSMVQALCETYGGPLCRVHLQRGDVQALSPDTTRRGAGGDASPRAGRTQAAAADIQRDAGWLCLYSFPTVDQLLRASETELRTLGFGYRSRYIVQCMHVIAAARTQAVRTTQLTMSSAMAEQHRLCCGEPFYEQLLQPRCSCAERRAALLTLPGVGRKVADCVLLFALGHTELVPVDTHMAQVASTYLTGAPPARGSTKRGRSAGNAFPRKRARKGAQHTTGTAVEGGGWQETLRAWRARGEATRVVSDKATAAAGGGRRKAAKKGSKDDNSTLAPLNDKLHDAIQAGFRQLFGPYCGLAHTVLFYERMRR